MLQTACAAAAVTVAYALWVRREATPYSHRAAAIAEAGHEEAKHSDGIVRQSVDRITTFYPSRKGRPSPLSSRMWPPQKAFVNTHETVILPPPGKRIHSDQRARRLPYAEYPRAGPRETIYWDPVEVRAAVVTCGGLCPGLNTVIREIVMCLHSSYGVKTVFGVQNGYMGFYSFPLLRLTPETVSEVHLDGGTFLGSSRGGFDLEKILDSLRQNKINHLYIIGGDGTHRGAKVIFNGARAAGMELAVACVPKTIDNDVPLIDKSFGFDSAVEQAVRVINSAHVEASSHKRGVGIVKLMGRHAGYIAMTASLASRQVNACLIPEMDWKCEALCQYISDYLDAHDQFVLVVAEGTQVCAVDREAVCGPDTGEKGVDASGNVKLDDVGVIIDTYIQAWFDCRNKDVNVKYIDPTYIIRSVPANPSDSILCAELAYNAVHGMFAGFTGFTVGKINNVQVMLNIDLVATQPARRVDTRSRQFVSLMLNTGQPDMR